MDKINIVAENCWKAENGDLRLEAGRMVKKAYLRGFRKGVEKASGSSPNTGADLHGEWMGAVTVRMHVGFQVCSCCGELKPIDNFCGNCGARNIPDTPEK